MRICGALRYIICLRSSSPYQALAKARPPTARELKQVEGLGENRIKNYGQQILDVSVDKFGG